MGTSRLVDVDVSVHEARKNHLVDHWRAGFFERPDRCDYAILDVDSGGGQSAACYDAPATKNHDYPRNSSSRFCATLNR